jgi:hypothetical protein
MDRRPERAIRAAARRVLRGAGRGTGVFLFALFAPRAQLGYRTTAECPVSNMLRCEMPWIS